MGFAANLMMKAHSLKEGVKEKSSGLNLGNVQVGRVSSEVLSPHHTTLSQHLKCPDGVTIALFVISLYKNVYNSPQGKGSL